MITDYVYAFIIWPLSLVLWLGVMALVDAGIAAFRGGSKVGAVRGPAVRPYDVPLPRPGFEGRSGIVGGTMAYLFARVVLMRGTPGDRHLP